MISAMTPGQTLKKLEALGTEKVRAQNAKNGAGDNQYGVKLGDIRKVAKEVKSDHELAIELWESAGSGWRPRPCRFLNT